MREKLLEKALNYIELNLKERLILEDIAAVANYSPWHFHRLFVATTGITVGEYIRKRRLSEAYRELVCSDKPIKQLSAEYQFDSQAAFTRSFKNFCGSNPGEMRRKMNPFMHYQAKLTIRNKGETMQNPRIIHKESFKVIGKSTLSTMKNNTIPALWGSFGEYCDKIPGTLNPEVGLGICFFEDMPEMTDETPFTYLAGMEVNADQPAPEGMQSRAVPEADYAVFEHHGSLDNLHSTYEAIYRDWLPESGYERAQSDDFELYDERFDYGKPHSVMEIWVPVVKK
jgi:AraC family transcriptional regulator